MQRVYQKLFIKLLGNLLSDPTCCVVLQLSFMLFIIVYWGQGHEK